jgi:Tol biopolymer transport system component
VSIDQLLTPEGFGGTLSAAWSPIDDRIALVERVDGDHHALWIIGADGSNPTKLVEFRSATYGGVDWMPGGRAIVYSALDDGRMQLYALPIAGGEPTRLTADDAGLIHPQASPDGRWIAATRIDRLIELRRLDLR